MKHIYIFNEGSRASVYGIGTYINQVRVCFANVEDVSLHLIELCSDVHFFEIEVVKDCDIYKIPAKNLSIERQSKLYYRNVWYLLKSYIQVSDCDKLIFLLNYTQHSLLVTRIKETFPAGEIFFTIHYQDWCFELNGNVSYFKQIIHTEKDAIILPKELNVYNSFEKERICYQSVDKIVCLSKFTQQLLLEEYGVEDEKISLIYNGLEDEGKLLSKSKKILFKKQMYFKANDKIILFVGRLDPIKGLKLLIKSFKRILTLDANCRLIIAGDGDFSVYLNECGDCRNKVTFTGRIGKDDLYNFYQIADVGVMPSMHEQCSYVAIEMMMFGVPLVISTTTGLKEIMDNEQFGYRFQMKDETDPEAIEILSEMILETITASGLNYQNMCDKSRKNYEKNYTNIHMKEQLEFLFE